MQVTSTLIIVHLETLTKSSFQQVKFWFEDFFRNFLKTFVINFQGYFLEFENACTSTYVI